MKGPMPLKQTNTLSCYHCGESCPTTDILEDDKYFCCEGCKMVYGLLHAHGLEQYYQLNSSAGTSQRKKHDTVHDHLDNPEVVNQLIDFQDQKYTVVRFQIPQIHCSSCLWLLENLHRFEGGIVSSRVNFLKKEAKIRFEAPATLKKVVMLLDSIGYSPNLAKVNKDEPGKTTNKSLLYKLGLSGFIFGNIMLFSFPEYLGLENMSDRLFRQVFSYLNLVLILPVIFYCAKDYLTSAINGLKSRHPNIDVPIALGILALFGRSAYEITTGIGSGYLDSLAGLIFFLLIGKWFQEKTYQRISFDRDYRSYFPMAITVVEDDHTRSVALEKLRPGDQMLIRHGEIVPTDGVLTSNHAQLDYSFVTGESDPVHLQQGDKVYAGGRQTGGAIHVVTDKKVDQSYLTSLWNDDVFRKSNPQGLPSKLANKVATYFTTVILLVAICTLIYWYPINPAIAFQSFTAVLIIACPCAVALSIPFTFGNVMRILGTNHFYLKNTTVIETLSEIDWLVFDKTGTITLNGDQKISYQGIKLSDEEESWVRSLVDQSNHPVSNQISHYYTNVSTEPVTSFESTTGVGLRASVKGHSIEIRKSQKVDTESFQPDRGTVLMIDNEEKGYYVLRHKFRDNLNKVIGILKQNYRLSLLTGDHASEKPALEEIFGTESHLLFRQSPRDKLNYIKSMQEKGHKVMMIGDGLNDAGALKQSNLGLVITDEVNNFVPACDAIMQAGKFNKLPQFLTFMHQSVKLIYVSYAIAFLYNIIGISFAVQGLLSPVIAAILMPLSSITIVLFGIGSSSWLAHRLELTSYKML